MEILSDDEQVFAKKSKREEVNLLSEDEDEKVRHDQADLGSVIQACIPPFSAENVHLEFAPQEHISAPFPET